MTYQREHQVWGWHQHTTDGEFESVDVITEDARDAVYVIVKRTIDGSDVRYVERIEPRYTDDAENAFCVDCGLSYNGASATTFSGLDHLEGEDVAVLADGNVVKGLSVSGGSVTIPRASTVVHIGLPFTPAMELLDVEPTAAVTDTVKAYEASVSKVTLSVQDTRGVWVGPADGDFDMREVKPRRESDGYGTIPLFTGQVDVIIENGWTRGGGIRIEQRDPLPMAILAAVPQVDVGG